jgi:glutamyl-tRNA reductase
VTHLVLVGLSHHTAPVALRERINFSREASERTLGSLMAQGFSEGVVLSTCNRAELYASAEQPDNAREELTTFLADMHGFDRNELAPHLYSRLDEDAARHLFRVSAGLDSLVVGEPQILGQVKEAYAFAAERQWTGALLNKLFHAAFTVGKRVRSETGLAEGAVSVSYAAIALAKKIFGDLKGRTVLIVGAGEMAKLTGEHLRAQHVRRILVVSRTMEHAAALAEQIEGEAAPWRTLLDALRSADIVVTATGSPVPVLNRADVAAAMRARGNQPLFLVDIAVPRDVEPAAGDLEQVFLYNIDDLQAIVSENLARRTVEVARAETLVVDEVGKFGAWMRSRQAIPTVVALRHRFEAIRQAELKRLEPKLSGLGPDARERVDEVTRLIVEKLLLTPTEQLKTISDVTLVTAYADALNRLFSLAEAEDEGQKIESKR